MVAKLLKFGKTAKFIPKFSVAAAKLGRIWRFGDFLVWLWDKGERVNGRASEGDDKG